MTKTSPTGTAVGGFIPLANANTFPRAVGFDSTGVRIAVYATILIVWITALYYAASTLKNEKKPVPET